MALEKKRQRKPAIILTRTDHERLYRLAEAHAGRNPDVFRRAKLTPLWSEPFGLDQRGASN
ncbi:hypothetical protein HNR26_004881 [Rhizobium rosettiformans]|jgi:hypothetical protein|uniref:Regulator of nucleoside diphosphate kinase N-terminal domain-containing protein n=1 Tax=Rhizobium rosettiformans TaxID=1368430 RepID=A0A7W8HVD6_9HYPH|nr:hypothetical protein [Rhizobium rosettiformans]MBB5278767.1 hypothetical protein [Rhizobium rosettiformans]